MNDKVGLEGPVELIDGKLLIKIPLNAGGDKLRKYASGISNCDEEYLIIEIKHWLAEKLNIQAGSPVIVDNQNRKFTITRSEKNDWMPRN